MCYAGGPRCSSEALRRLERTQARYNKLLTSGEGFSKQTLAAKDAYETAIKEWELTPAGVRSVEQQDPLRAEILRQTALTLLQRRRAEDAALYFHEEDIPEEEQPPSTPAEVSTLKSLDTLIDINDDPRARDANEQALHILTTHHEAREDKTTALASLMGIDIYAFHFLGKTDEGEYLSAPHLHGLASCFLDNGDLFEQTPSGDCGDFSTEILTQYLLDAHEEQLHPQTLGLLATHKLTDPKSRYRAVSNPRTSTAARVEGTRLLTPDYTEDLLYSFTQEPNPAPALALALAQQLHWQTTSYESESDLTFEMARQHLLTLGYDPSITSLPGEWLDELLGSEPVPSPVP